MGKTTLVKELESIALAEGYLATDELVPVLAADTAERLFGRVPGALYDTILANRPQSGDAPAMRDTQILVRTARLGTGGANVSARCIVMHGALHRTRCCTRCCTRRGRIRNALC